MTNQEFIESIALEGEEWRDVVGYEGKYWVSSYGRVYTNSPIYGFCFVKGENLMLLDIFVWICIATANENEFTYIVLLLYISLIILWDLRK